MFGCLRWRELIIVRYRVLAALVRVCSRSALAFKAAIRSLATRGTGRETVKGPEQQDHYYQADRDVNTPSHPALE